MCLLDYREGIAAPYTHCPCPHVLNSSLIPNEGRTCLDFNLARLKKFWRGNKLAAAIIAAYVAISNRVLGTIIGSILFKTIITRITLNPTEVTASVKYQPNMFRRCSNKHVYEILSSAKRGSKLQGCDDVT
eukprot:XP_025984759.1 uncharacterized protein LOC102669889 [Glycine max]